MVFHLRSVTWSAGYSPGGPSTTFSIVSYSGIPCPALKASFPHLLMARPESYCLQLCNIQRVKYQIFSLNYSTSSTVFLLSYLFLRLIAIEQIFTNAGSWGDMTLHEYKCIPLIHSTKCFLFKVTGRKEIDIYWILTVCQELYIFISI